LYSILFPLSVNFKFNFFYYQYAALFNALKFVLVFLEIHLIKFPIWRRNKYI